MVPISATTAATVAAPKSRRTGTSSRAWASLRVLPIGNTATTSLASISRWACIRLNPHRSRV